MQRPGQRILPPPDGYAPELLARYATLSPALVSDVMGRMGTPHAPLRAIVPPAGTVAGVACTVLCRPGDNLLLHKALQMARAGDVLVVGGQADPTAASMGYLMALRAASRGVVALVVDGLVRDVAGLRALGLPVFARGVTPRGPTKDGLGEINVPVSVAGVVVNPGDLVVADADGLAIVPRDAVDRVAEDAAKKELVEAEQEAAIRAGRYDTRWIDAELAKRGYVT